MKIRDLLKKEISTRYLVIFCLVAAVFLLHIYGILDYTSLPRDMSSYAAYGGDIERVYIQPFGSMDTEVLEYSVDFLREDMGRSVEVLPPMQIPNEAWGRPDQANAEYLLDLISKNAYQMDDCFRIIGLTQKDLYVEDLNFVFGLGELPGKACMMSFNRLHPTDSNYEPVYILTPKQEKLFKTRIRKLLRHELGHTFGLEHCFRHDCVMQFANSLEEADDYGEFYCPHCARTMRIIAKTQRK